MFSLEMRLEGTRSIGYQTLINQALGQYLGTAEKPITAEQVRKIVRDELAQVR